MLIENLERK